MRTPDVPGRSTAHTPGQAGLHARQEVVVLLLLAGLLRPVEEVVLGDGYEVTYLVCKWGKFFAYHTIIVAGLHVLPRLVLQPDPREDLASLQDVVKAGVVDDDSVAELRVEVEGEGVVLTVTCRHLARIYEAVTHPVVEHGHVAPPQGGVHPGLLHTGVQRKSILRHTALNFWR